ncbi:MAG TPA: hypothetical protein VFX85_07260 [Solirubrobacterales bacterium]|nr:hypothetical protein [Solirubrobacterales bacterium]
MLFSLEALRAKQGDSLLLHYGDPGDPRLIVIDGGPSGVYKDALKPRLEQLCEAAGGKLSIELLMVSHIDSDHIKGVLEFSQKLLDEPQRQGDYKVKTLWHNKFEDVVGGEGAVAEAEVIPPGARGAVASVPEGQRLRDNARGLKWTENKGFKEFVMAPDDAGVPVDLGPLKLTVVGPRQAELDELREKWEKEAKPSQRGATPAAIEPDDSIPNLSSIVCVAELDGKRMLLTGDALGTKVIEGLETAGFLKSGNGKMKLDLLKVPHHGSCRNVTAEFFERLPARHLVISADGKHGNPDIETLEMISEGRPDDAFTLHLTEAKFKDGVGPKIEDFFAKEKKAGRKYDVVFRPDDQLSLQVDLLDPQP